MKGMIKGRNEESENASRENYFSPEEQIKRQVTAIYTLLANFYGSDKLVMKAGKWMP